jgi:hypothetical protein
MPSNMIDSAEQLLLQQQGRCRGLQSQLELVANAQLPVSSRQAALKEFHQWVLEHTGMDDVNIAEPLDDADSNNAAMHLGKKSIMVPPMLIHKQNKRSERDGSGPKHPLILPSAAPEDLIEQEEWKSVGSTKVDLLLLNDVITGDETIAAVAPTTTLGGSQRSVQLDPNTRASILVFGLVLGPLSIVKSASTNPQLIEANDRAETEVDAIVRRMKANAVRLSEDTDFPARTVALGKRILHRVPMTAEQTFHRLPTTVEQTAGSFAKLVKTIVERIRGEE